MRQPSDQIQDVGALDEEAVDDGLDTPVVMIVDERLEPLDEEPVDDRAAEMEVTRAEIERTRAEMSDTIDAIREKLSPAHLAEQAKETVREATLGRAQQAVDTAKEAVASAVDTAREAMGNAVDTARDTMGNAMDTARDAMGSAVDTARGASSSVWDTIRENPWPVALTGFGLAWLWMSAQKRRPAYQGYQGEYAYGYTPSAGSQRFAESSYPATTQPGHNGPQGLGASVSQTVSDLQDQAGDMVGRAQDAIGQVAGRAQEQVGQFMDRAQQSVGEYADRAQDTVQNITEQARYQATLASKAAQEQWEQTTDSVQRMFRENPLAVGTAAMAIGLAAGLAVPETPREHQFMGETRDRLAQQAQQTAQEIAQKVQTVAAEAMDTAKEEARKQGLTPDGNGAPAPTQNPAGDSRA